MKRSNFTNDQIAALVKTFGSQLQVSVNKAGNIKLLNNNEATNAPWVCPRWSGRGFWTLYLQKNGTYLWRRHDGNGHVYPLNMKRRIIDIYPGYRPWDRKKSSFATFEEAVDYFIGYLEKYRDITIK